MPPCLRLPLEATRQVPPGVASARTFRGPEAVPEEDITCEGAPHRVRSNGTARDRIFLRPLACAESGCGSKRNTHLQRRGSTSPPSARIATWSCSADPVRLYATVL